MIKVVQSISFAIEFYILIGYRQCGLKEILIRLKYILKERPIKLTTDIVAVAIDLLDGNVINNHWCLRFVVLNKHFSSESFILLLQSFIGDVIITDFVLNSIYAFNMMKFHNKFQDYDLSKEKMQR